MRPTQTFMRAFITFTFLLCLAGMKITSAQSIGGQTLNASDGKPLKGVLVQAVSFRDSSKKLQTKTDSAGYFSLAASRGFYKVSLTKPGYLSKTLFAKIIQADTNFGPVILADSATALQTVIVNAKPLAAVQKGDTTEYSAGAYKTNPDATAEDLAKKMPGVTIQNGQVTAHGEQVKKVTVDGKEWFGDDAAAVLRNLPAEVVDKIQVFDRMSDQSTFSRVDDGSGSKSLNIVTKKGMQKGSFGKAYAGYGTNDRYQGGANYNYFNGERRLSVLGMLNNINQQNFSSQDLLSLSSGSGGSGRGGMGQMGGGMGGYQGGGMYGGQNNFQVNQANGISTTRALGLNYTDKFGKRWNIAASYFLNSSVNDKSSDIYRSYINRFNTESSQTYNENSLNTNNSLNHRLNLRLSFSPDSNNTFLYTPRISWQHTDISQDFHAGYFLKTATLNSSVTNYSNIGHGLNLNNTLLYMHKFSKPGRTVSVNLSHELNTKVSNAYNNNTNTVFIPIDSIYDVRQNVANNSPGIKASSRITYTEPLSKFSTLQAEYAYNYNVNNNNKTTSNYDTATKEYSQQDNQLSNKMNSHYSTHQAGLMYMFRNEKLWFSAGGNVQAFRLIGEELKPLQFRVNYPAINFLPRIMMSYKFSKSASMRMFGRTSTNAPSISQLQNVIDNSNPLLLSTGNPNLKQEVSRFAVVRFTKVNVSKGRNFFVGMMGNFTQNYISNSTSFFTKDSQISEGFTALKGTQITQPVNLQGYYNTRIFGNYGLPVKWIGSNVNFNAAYSYTNTPGLINGIKNVAGTQNYTAGVVISSNVSQNLDFTLFYSGSYYNTVNSYQKQLNNKYYNHVASAKINWIIKQKLVLSTDANFNNYSGLSQGYNQSFVLWNSGIAWKFLKNKAAELKFSCFDMLKQNKSISRTITESYVEDNSTRVLTRYFMFTFTYTLRKYNMPQQQAPQGHGGPGGPPYGMPPH